MSYIQTYYVIGRSMERSAGITWATYRLIRISSLLTRQGILKSGNWFLESEAYITYPGNIVSVWTMVIMMVSLVLLWKWQIPVLWLMWVVFRFLSFQTHFYGLVMILAGPCQVRMLSMVLQGSSQALSIFISGWFQLFGDESSRAHFSVWVWKGLYHEIF